MCGIAGIYDLKSKADTETLLRQAKRMLFTLRHRGPDGENFYQDKRLALAFCRLSIIDLSPAAMQPMVTEDKKIVFACNGEIYNFHELRQGLQKKGHFFKSRGDSEVIGHLYEEFNSDFIQKLNGMFAIVLWDSKREKLILARDRLGIKPLYYSVIGQKIVFASEIKAILRHSAIRKDVDFESLDFYLSYQAAPFHKTIFKNITPVLPGEIIIIEKGRIKKEKYWELDAGETAPCSLVKVPQNILNLLTDSLEKELVADVPLGLSLSGGIDSGGLLALIKKVAPQRRIQTFTLGFDLGRGALSNHDDFYRARRLAGFFKTDHREFIIDRREFIDNLEEITGVLDEPSAVSPSAFFVFREASRYIKVILGGEGADEIFGGYSNHVFAGIRFLLQSCSNGKQLDSLKRKFSDFLKRFNIAITKETAEYEWLTTFGAVFRREEKDALYAVSSLRDLIGNFQNFFKNFFCALRTRDVVNRALAVDVMLRLPQINLLLLDRFSLHHSIEARVPYLDHRLVEFSFKLSGGTKIKKENRKFVLKKVFENLLPKYVCDSPKTPFKIPRNQWLPFFVKDYIRPTLSSKNLKKHNFFNNSFVQDLFREISRPGINPNPEYNQIWSLFIFQIWWNKYFG